MPILALVSAGDLGGLRPEIQQQSNPGLLPFMEAPRN